MATPQNNPRQNMDLKMTTNNSSHEQQLDGSPENDIAEGDDTMSLKRAIDKHGGEEYNVQETITGIKHVKTNIDTLPPELALRIFGLLQKATAVCLGLTCPRLYACLKYQYPDPICLLCHEGCGSKCDVSDFSHYAIAASHASGWIAKKHWNHELDVGSLIENWMGPQYTLVTMDVGLRERYSIFVHSNVCNCSTGVCAWNCPLVEYVRSLERRYNDWEYAAFDNQVSTHDHGFRSRLPKPYNKGDSWYAEATAAIKEDIIQFDNVADWTNFWHSFEVVRDKRERDTFDLSFEEFSLEQMHDGIKFLGL